MYQRNERNKLVFKPKMLKQGNKGLYIICENDEELETCIKNFHKLGIPWKSGGFDGVSPKMPTYAKIKNAETSATFLESLLRPEMKNYTLISVGNSPECMNRLYSFGYYGITKIEDELPEFLNVPRILFKNVEWDFSLSIDERKRKIEVETV